MMPGDDRKLTGKALIARMQAFLHEHAGLQPLLKITSKHGGRVLVHVIRCTLLERFLDILDEESIIAHIQNEHNIIALFLHEVLEPGEPARINERIESGLEIDILIKNKRAEVKTTRDVDASDVPDLIHHWFDDMVASQGDKEAWWLVYFVQRGDGNVHIGKDCIYYLVAIEIPTYGLEDRDEQRIISETVALIQGAEKKVKKDDGILEGALLPVDNVVHADRLRKKLKEARTELQRAEADTQRAEADTQRAEADTQRAEADTQRAKANTERAEAERDHLARELAKKDKEMAELKKQLGKQ